MTAWGILTEATMKAACKAIIHKGHKPSEVDYTALTDALKATLKANIDKVQGEWKDATDAHMSDGWLRELMNAQANEMALDAIASIGL